MTMVDRGGFTAATTLNLPTPFAIRQVLGLLGLSWEAQVLDGEQDLHKLPAGPGMYVWVVGAKVARDPMRAGGLYVGIGRSRDGGLSGRLRRELAEVDPEAWTGFGLAMDRNQAAITAGPVTWSPLPKLGWLNREAPELAAWAAGPRGWPGDWDKALRGWLTGDERPEPTQTAEAIAIRAGIYLGGVGFAVNSLHAGAWEVDYSRPDKGREDAAAWVAVKHLLRDEPSQV